MTRYSNQDNSRLPDEMELFKRESMQAIGGVKRQLKREKQVRRTTQTWLAIVVIVLILGAISFPGPIKAAIRWLAGNFNVPFRHGGHAYISGIGFSTGGNAYSPGPTRRWIDEVRVFEWRGDEWVLELHEDFESDEIGSQPEGWYEDRQHQAETHLFVGEAGNDDHGLDLGRSVAFTDTVGGNYGAMMSWRFDKEYTGKVAIEWWERHETLNDSLVAELQGDLPRYGPFTVAMYGNVPGHEDFRGQIILGTANPETGEEETPGIFQWTPNVWYQLRVEIDVPSQSFDFYVGDELVDSSNAFEINVRP